MKDRIKQLMESQHMNQQSFASYLGLAPATLCSILQERTRPTLNTVDAICRKMPTVNLTWLMTGNGEMFSTTGSDAQDHGEQLQGSPAATGGQPAKETSLSFSFEEEPRSMPAASPVQQSSARQQMQPRSQMNYGEMKNLDKTTRRITEIRVFYDDQTWESFVPKK